MKRFFHINRFYRVAIFVALFMSAGIGMADAAKVTLTWDKPDGDVAGYRIYYGQEGSDAVTPGITIKPNQTRCEISGLGQGQRYWFEMKYFDKDGVESLLSDQFTYDVPILEVNNDGIGDAAIANGDPVTEKPGEAAPEIPENEVPSPVENTEKPGLFTGKYFVTEVSDSGEFSTGFLTADFDSTGTLTCSDLFKSGGEKQTNLKTAYSFTDEGLLIVDGERRGTVSADRRFYVSGNMAKDGIPGTRLGIRQTAGLNTADLEGEYRLFTYYMLPGNGDGQPVTASESGLVEFDGAGNIAFIKGAGFSGSCEVDAETGRLTITPTETFSPLHGALSENGSIFAAVDTDKSDGTLMFVIGVKSMPNLQVTDLAGTYFINEFTQDDLLDTTGYLVDMYIDSDGSYSALELDTTCECPPESRSGVLSVDPTGEIQAVADKAPATGGLSPEGDLLTVVGERSIGIGLQQAENAEPSDPAPASSGGGGGGGGCFIGTLSF